VTAGTENTIRIWDVDSRTVVKTLYYSGGSEKVSLKAVAFSPDEKHVYALGDNWTLFRFPLVIDELVADARRRAAGAVLKDDDCLKYLHQTPCPALRSRQ
jgi:hypothetical protein